MPSLVESIWVATTPQAAWELYFEPRSWAAWVDGFGAIEASRGYPESGGELVWRSSPAGRGRVSERVLEHAPPHAHRISFSDPESQGELETRFEPEGEGTRLTLGLDYELSGESVLAKLTERIFVRGQMRASLQRTLERFKHEAEEVVSPPGRSGLGPPR